MHVVATAGHVDHGKSALVQALTGIDPDRLVEEKQRGLTVDLGFAWTTLPGPGEVVFVDVPGHARFISNMLAGVAVVQAGLLCVDAREGWRVQTEEHLQVLDLTRLPVGLVAITKVGLVDRERVASVTDQVARHVKGTVLEDAPVVACDSVDGTGLGELRDRLGRILVGRPAPTDAGRPRLWVDRSFVMSGAGTVVTGGGAGGRLAPGDQVEVVGPQGRSPARIRGIQALGRPVEEAPPGSRAALNLAGIDRKAVRRGDAVVRPDHWQLTSRMDATLEVLPSLAHEVTRRGAYLVHLGSGEHPAALDLAGTARLAPGQTGDVRLRLDYPLAISPGDRYVLRETGRSEIIGGGEILDIAPAGRRAAHPGLRGLRGLRGLQPLDAGDVPPEYDWVRADALERRFGIVVEPALDGWVVSQATLKAARDRLSDRIAGARPVGLEVGQLGERDRAVLDLLVQEGGAETVAGYAVHPAWLNELADDPYVELLERFAFSPPSPTEAAVPPDVLRALVRRGLVVVKGGIYFAASALDAAQPILAELAARRQAGFTAGEARRALGTTRKWAIPLLELLDEAQVTLRHGDHRVLRSRVPRSDP